MCRFRGHESAHLRKDGDERVLTQEGRFSRHVRPGDEPDASAAFVREIAIVRNECAAARLCQRGFDDRMTPAANVEGEAFVDLRPHVALAFGQFCERGIDIEHGNGASEREQGFAVARGFACE